MAPTATPDRVGSAIAAVADKAEPVSVRIDVGPGRFVMLAVPADLNLAEVLGMVGFLSAGGLARAMAEARGPQLQIARVMPT